MTPSSFPTPIVHDILCSWSTSSADRGREGILVTTFGRDARGILWTHEQMFWKAGPILPVGFFDPTEQGPCGSPFDDGPDGVLFCAREKGHDGACG